MSRPVLLATIARNLGVEVEAVEEWSKLEGFPLAGDGVARLDEVKVWLSENGVLGTGEAAEQVPPEAAVESPVDDSQADESSDELSIHPVDLEDANEVVSENESGVEWVTIRVPVVKGSSRRLAARLRHTFSLRSRDLHIREGYGCLIDGCQKAQVRLSDNTAVDNASAAFRYLGELLSQVGQ